jgi:hypothetical protein
MENMCIQVFSILHHESDFLFCVIEVRNLLYMAQKFDDAEVALRSCKS